MEARLIQSQTQKLVLSPLIRQYLRLLQLPVVELRTAIEQELAENPALEELSRETAEETTSLRQGEDPSEQEREAEELRFDKTLRSLDRVEEQFYGGLYGSEDLSSPEIQEVRNRRDYQESLITRKESLYDFLLWQIGFLELSDLERKIAEEIAGNVTDDGYLNASLEEIAGTCNASLAEVEKVLTQIQTLDPPGIAARNLQEALLLQLNRKGSEADFARRIVQDYLPLLEKKQWNQIAHKTQASEEAIRAVAQLITHLDPKPGRMFYGEDSIAVTPDATISFSDTDDGKLTIDIHDEVVPEVRVSSYYRRLLRDPKLDETSRRFLKEKIQSAIDFVKALGQRRSTLGRITEELVKAQTEFFEKGFSHLKPLRLKDIAARLGIHESTVSRAIQGKYLATPQGTLPYKSFFSSKLERTEGGEESQKSIMEKVKELIRSEDPRNPLSDQAIAERVRGEGVKIARRTVAKYRELLRILPTHLRRQR